MTQQTHFQPCFSVTLSSNLQLPQAELVTFLSPRSAVCCSEGQDLLCCSSDYLPVKLSVDFSSAVPKLMLLFHFGMFFPEAQNSTLKYEFSSREGERLFSHRTWGRTGEGVWFSVTLPTCDFWPGTQSVEWKALGSSWLHSTAQESLPDFSGQFKSAQTLVCSLLCKWAGMSICAGGLTPYQNLWS